MFNLNPSQTQENILRIKVCEPEEIIFLSSFYPMNLSLIFGKVKTEIPRVNTKEKWVLNPRYSSQK